MVENRHRVQVNIKSNIFRAVPEVVANDKVIFEIEVWDGATRFPLLETYSYMLTSLKLGGQSVIREGTLSGDLIVFELGTSEMTAPGKVEGTVQIYDENNDRISSAKFDYVVKRDPSLQGSLPADNTSLIIANEALLTESVQKSDTAIADSSTALTKATAAETTANDVRSEFDLVVAEAGSSNPEVVQARGEFVNLNERMTSIVEDLAEKASKDAVFTMANMGQDIKTAMTGGSVAVVGVDAVDTVNLKNKSATPEKTTFLTVGKNLFDKNRVTSGYFVGSTDGTLGANVDFSASDFIQIEPSTSYTITGGAYSRAFYDANKTYISGQSGAGITATFTTPSNAKYVRVSIYKDTPLGSYMLEKGATATSYEPFQYIIVNTKLEGSVFINELNKQFTSLVNDTFKEKFYNSGIEVKLNQLTGYVAGKNLFNKDKATSGGYISEINGAVVTSTGFYYSEYIPVLPNTQYSRKGTYRYAFYDSNKVFISGANDKATLITTPANAAYVRISTYQTDLNGVAGIDNEQLEKGSVSSSYESYSYSLKYLTVPDTNAASINLPSKIYGLVGQELNIYFDNIMSDKDTRFDYDVTCDIGGQYDNFFRATPTAAGNFPITIVAFKDDKEVARATSTIIVKAASVGNAVTKTALIIGDSTTDNNFIVPKLNGNFASDVMKIQTIGTRGTAPNKHEGRAGWTTRMFFGENASYTSPFMFNGVFDFSQYISTNGLTTPDYVFINLGINDFFGYTDDSSLNTEMAYVLGKYQTMIDKIKLQNANVKIGICLTIPPNYSQSSFGVSYKNGQTRKRYKRNNFLWVKKLNETFGNREAENIYLVPIHTNLDTRNNFDVEQKQINARNTTMVNYPTSIAGVHPAESGYWQIADSYWYFLKSFEV